ncbi:cytochrome c553 [Bosea sp. BE125]|uniref:c-type cytochrome n=1 Tax=Bosea sp. BE125 TaxID=2817909 RepID=UPI00285C8210|nr:c-type cytochrome [Bosea sp. BE125]MDR6874671.1 cytochrome c553 [Bosea sp. BE125]
MGWDGIKLRHAQSPAGFVLLGAFGLLFGAAPVQAAGDRALGEYLASECTSCHQLSGRSPGGIPPIVGWPEEQFVAVLNSYARKERGNQTMQTIAARLSRDDVTALATYFASLTPEP